MGVGDVLDAPVGEVLVRHRLVDGVDRAQAHRHGRELPEVRHETRVRVRRDAVGRGGLLLTEAVELRLGQPSLEEGPRIRARGGVPLHEDLVSAGRVIGAAEEVVEPDLVQSSGGRVGGDVTADGDTGSLGAMHRDGRVPADPRAVAPLDLLVTGELGLVLRRDRVDVVRRGDHGHAEVQILGPLEQAEHDLAPAAVTLGRHQLLERLLPFGRLLGIAVEGALGVRILVVDSHGRPFVVWQIVPGNRLRCGIPLFGMYNTPRSSLASPSATRRRSRRP